MQYMLVGGPVWLVIMLLFQATTFFNEEGFRTES